MGELLCASCLTVTHRGVHILLAHAVPADTRHSCGYTGAWMAGTGGGSSGADVADIIIDGVIRNFFQRTLRPCVLHTSEVRARSATVYLHGMVADLAQSPLDPRLLDLLLRFLIGDAIADAAVSPSVHANPFSPAAKHTRADDFATPAQRSGATATAYHCASAS